MLFPEPIETLGEGRFLRLSKIGRWEFAQRTNTRGAAAILAVTERNEVILIRQPRASVNKYVIELPAGLVGDEKGRSDESFIAAAGRELLEETGYEARTLLAVADGIPSAGLSNETVTLFIATDLRHVTDKLGDGAEVIQRFLVPLDQLHPWLEARKSEGCLIDLKIFAALYFLGRR